MYRLVSTHQLHVYYDDHIRVYSYADESMLGIEVRNEANNTEARFDITLTDELKDQLRNLVRSWDLDDEATEREGGR